MSDTTLIQQAAQIEALRAEIDRARLDGRISGLRWAAQRDADIAEGH